MFFIMAAPDATGLLLVAEHLFTLAAVATLMAVCGAIGVALMRKADVSIPDRSAALGVWVAVGAGVLGTLMLVAGWV